MYLIKRDPLKDSLRASAMSLAARSNITSPSMTFEGGGSSSDRISEESNESRRLYKVVLGPRDGIPRPIGSSMEERCDCNVWRWSERVGI